MTLLITIIAAVVATIVWYVNENRDAYKLGTLSFIYWGASLMWLMDFVAEYKELGADYFAWELADIINDSLLGVAVVALGLVAWIIVILVKDPKGVIKNKLSK